MARLKSVYCCQECGHSAPKWAGQCPGCGAWNTLVEEAVEERPSSGPGTRSAPRPLTDFSSELTRLSEAAGSEELRVPTRVGEVDRLLGGGLVAGQVALLAGPPGIGKSTLMLQIAGSLSAARRVLYVSGEESLAQVSGRAKRLGVPASGIDLLCETDLSKILDAVRRADPGVIVLDSIQTVYHPELSGGPGSVGQVRECAAELLRAAKARGAILLILGHVTKEGAVAGPKVLEHIVDTVLQFDTERRQLLRVLRAEKNRFGPSSEVGFFEMGEKGLREVPDASAFFLEDRGGPAPGRAVSVALEGTRPLIVEVQALVVPTRYPLPRRMATGLDLNRTLVLIAALEKHLGLRLENRDVFVSVAGGLKIKDPALDLAVGLAIASSARERALPEGLALIGEVGLLGEVGRVPFLEARLREAERLGLSRAVVAARSSSDLAKSGVRLKIRPEGAPAVSDAARACLGADE